MSIVVVVSPLIALMMDQVRAMLERRLSMVYVWDCNDEKAVAVVCNGQYQLVFMSPDALLTDKQWRTTLLSEVYNECLVALVVDEVHCVKKW